VIDSWTTSIRDAAERDDKDAPDPFDHKAIPHLLGDYINEIEAAEERKSDAENRKDAFESGDPPGAEPVEEDWADDPESSSGQGDRYDHYLDERIEELKAEMKGDTAQATAYQEDIRKCEKQQTQYQQIKAEIKEAKQKAKDLRSQLLDRMDDAREALTPDEEANLVLTVARTELADELEGYVDAHRQRVVAAFENWWEKYHTTMQDIKGRREETTKKLNDYLEVMGYE
jgi:type I restriction enzyme M protein